MEPGIIDRLVDLRRRKAALKAETSEVQKELDAVEAHILQTMAAEGTKTISREDGVRVTSANRFRVKRKDGVVPVQIAELFFSDPETHGLVTVNTQTLTAHVKECVEERGELSEALAALVEYETSPRLSVAGVK